MATSGLDCCDTHIFDGTHFARWKHHMLDHFRAKGPKFWWVVTSGLTQVLDHKNLTKAQKVLFDLDANAFLYLIDSLSFEMLWKVNRKGTAHELWESIKNTFGDSTTCDDGKFKKEETKVKAVHEDVEHDHNNVVVEDCSTSWSSEDVDDTTSSSLDKMEDGATSDAIHDDTSCTLDDEEDGYESDASTSSTTSPHGKVSLGNCWYFLASLLRTEINPIPNNGARNTSGYFLALP
jgi:hypothetical protein